MTSIHRGAGLLFALATAFALVPAGAAQASAADSAATWTLNPGNQRICVTPEHGWPQTYFLASVTGSTAEVIETRIQKLPPGSSSQGGRIYPDELNRTGTFVGFVHVSIAPTPVGEYAAELRASDGTATQTAPVTISVKDDCLHGT
ncbi:MULTISPECIES: DUF5980 family protein [unclassified Streptomyces]|uniref:DUF5980 family protein n=1 Tax=unclassified Streptomyces TaxID=2593676 RepID=UPI0008050342|nr:MULTISPECIES: DUF5980 family protein [unclassified Streptomyces]MYR74342.1 hypothetical protein [Streptomyces sp. SID4925]SBV03656.1 hypothetical protein YUMDRAFT_03212 [Streptomyces sp. OspMP-M45]